jgi:dihydrofolate synthase / folylpolyglutamate synthase
VTVIGTGAYGRALDALSARGPGRMVPDLTRVTALVGLLGDPQRAYRSVHVTGTNGKGSITRITSALLEGLGLRTGTYVSPHLQDVRERMMTSLRPIAPERFAALHTEVELLAALVDAQAAARDGEGADRVTFFELLTAMAYGHFADEAIDVAVVEVGLGGRWDATNVLDADVAVIGEIDLDHTILGGTPEEIATEKVGIIKQGCHVVSAVQRPGVAAIVERAVRERGGSLSLVDRDVRLLAREVTAGGQRLDVELHGRRLEGLELPLRGEHQARNLLAALAAVHGLLGPTLDAVGDELLRSTLARVTVPGRLELIATEPAVVIDGAHNPHAARALAHAMPEAFPFRDVILVVACLADKDIDGILAALVPVASHVIVAPAPSERSADVADLARIATALAAPRGVSVEVADDVLHGVDLAVSICGPADGVLVSGSLTTVGAVRERYLPSSGDEPSSALAASRGAGVRTLVVGMGDLEVDDLRDDLLDGPTEAEWSTADDDAADGCEDGAGDDRPLG